MSTWSYDQFGLKFNLYGLGFFMWGYAACIAIVCFNIRGWHEEAKTNHNACTSNRNIEYLPKNYSQGLDVFKESNFEPNQDNFLNNISYTPSQEWPGQHKFVPIHSQVKNSGWPKVSTPEADLGNNNWVTISIGIWQPHVIHNIFWLLNLSQGT